MDSLKLVDAEIAGAMTEWNIEAAFARAPLVLREKAAPRRVLVVSRYAADAAEGHFHSGPEWEALLRSQEASAFHLTGLEPRVFLWVFGSEFWSGFREFRADLDAEHLLFQTPWTEDAGSVTACLVREDQRSGGVRAAWASAAALEARRLLRAGKPRQALPLAQLAFEVEPRMSPGNAALLALVFQLTGRAKRGEGYLAAVRNSEGNTFGEEVTREFAELRRHGTKVESFRPFLSALNMVPGLAAKRAA